MVLKSEGTNRAVALVVSVGAHVLVLSSLTSLPVIHAPPRLASAIAFSVLEPEPESAPQLPEPEPEPEPEPPLPAPELEPEPEPEPEPPLPALEPAPLEQPEGADEAPLEQAEPVQELTGTTLAADDGKWGAPAGSGRSRSGPVQPGVSRPVVSVAKNPPPVAAKKKKPAQVAAVPLKELSRQPKPPSLGAALKRNYPKTARQQGLSGEAKVRARIDASGAIVAAKLVLESSSGFGEACRKTLLGSRWSAPLDKRGKPVPTWISYRCRFRIDR